MYYGMCMSIHVHACAPHTTIIMITKVKTILRLKCYLEKHFMTGCGNKVMNMPEMLRRSIGRN